MTSVISNTLTQMTKISGTLSTLFFSDEKESGIWRDRCIEEMERSGAQIQDMVLAIQDTYLQNQTFKNGYSRLAYIFMGLKNWKKAKHFFELDFQLGRSTLWMKIRYAETLFQLGEADGAVDWIENIYSENRNAKNGFTALAILFNAERERKRARELLDKDIVSGRITFSAILSNLKLIASFWGEDKIIDILEEFYLSDQTLRDGYINLALALKDSNEDSDRILKFTKRDYELGRLSAEGLLDLAQIQSECGDFEQAMITVEEAYDTSSDIKDGYCRIAWEQFGNRRSPENLIDIMEKDLRSQRISPTWKLNLAQAYASSGEWEKGLWLVSKAYGEDVCLKDGYSKIGWAAFKKCRETDRLLEYLKKDFTTGRMSPGWKLNFAEVYAEENNLEEALRLVSVAYSEDETMRDGFFRIAFAAYDTELNPHKILDYIHRDLKENRLSSKGKHRSIPILIQCGEYSLAHELLKELDDQDFSSYLDIDLYDSIEYYRLPEAYYQEGVSYYRQLHKEGKLGPRGKCNYARFLGKMGCGEHALEVFQEACGESDELKETFGTRYAENTFYAYYDLAYAPLTFDFVAFLFRAEIHAKKNDYTGFMVVLPPGTFEGFRQNISKHYNTNDTGVIQWRFSNIILPAHRFAPSCKGIVSFSSRAEYIDIWSLHLENRDTFPTQYHPFSLGMHWKIGDINRICSTHRATLKATSHGLKHVADWKRLHCGEKKLITITLRECDYEKARNSNYEEWVRFGSSIDQTEYFPVFVRDTDAAFLPLPDTLKGQTFFHEAAWNLELRMALYQTAYLNLWVNNGTSTLGMYNKNVKYLMFKWVTENTSSSSHAFKSQNMESGSQFPFSTPYQKIIWEDDRFDILSSEFEAMCKRIEATEVRQINQNEERSHRERDSHHFK